jgi:hypothetical protein
MLWAAPEQIKGMRVGGLAHRKRLSRIASERKLQSEARRKASKELDVNHALRSRQKHEGLAYVVSSRSVVKPKLPQASVYLADHGLRLQPRGL